jgi:hypothetical protein
MGAVELSEQDSRDQNGAKSYAGLQAVAAYLQLRQSAQTTNDAKLAERAAVKELLGELALRAPGHSVELRVPPHGVTQIVAGPRHRRGQPSATIEMDGQTLIGLCLGEVGWQEAIVAGRVLASGERADLSGLLPLRPLDHNPLER